MSEWNKEAAEWYAKKYGEYATNRLAVEALDLAPSAAILDVGCGTGSALRHAFSRVPSGTLIGVDPVPRMVEIAREQTASHAGAERIEYREGPAERLPVDDASADVVFAFDSIDHWQDRAAGFAEIRRVLRGDGRLVVVKDGGIPGGAAARAAFRGDVEEAGFQIQKEQDMKEDQVSFTMWICSMLA